MKQERNAIIEQFVIQSLNRIEVVNFMLLQMNFINKMLACREFPGRML
jgi:hypothetical protein